MSTLVIKEYEPVYQQAFEQLNKSWLTKYFRLEPIDEYVLTQPEEAIIQKGGAILVAVFDDIPAGVVALRKVDNDTYEFTKMAVNEQFHRNGIAKALSYAAFDKARQLGGKKVILFSHTSLQPAIALYRKLGFIEVPMDALNEYVRSDIKMEILLEELVSKF